MLDLQEQLQAMKEELQKVKSDAELREKSQQQQHKENIEALRKSLTESGMNRASLSVFQIKTVVVLILVLTSPKL